MRVRGIEFGKVLGASGVQGFFGEGYRIHRILRPDFSGMTFVAKTVTLHENEGNMPLKEDGVKPKELFPDCIYVKFFQGIALNAVGLSNKGIAFYLDTGIWQARKQPFFLSFMSIAKTVDERLHELKEFVDCLLPRLSAFQAPIGLQWNLSCPNVGLNTDVLLEEANAGLDILAKLQIPIMIKLDITTPPELAKPISDHAHCHAICVSNTVKWGKIPEKINWKNLFKSKNSPLAKYGGGGLSGAPLLPLVADWVTQARMVGIAVPINAGGGILRPENAKQLIYAGADSVFIGSMAFLRPFRVKPTIEAITNMDIPCHIKVVECGSKSNTYHLSTNPKGCAPAICGSMDVIHSMVKINQWGDKTKFANQYCAKCEKLAPADRLAKTS